jgi:hypothetical protein
LGGNSKEIEYKPPISVKAGQIQFVESCHPPLMAGEYVVSMRQQIKESKEALVPWNSDPYASELAFRVDAPRFTLNPGDIHSVYPPVNEAGRFDNALPHVVFTRRTLPWERKLDGIPPQMGESLPPWLALLLLQEEELHALDNRGEIKALPVFSRKEESLLRALSSDVLVPDLGQEGVGKRNTPHDVVRQQTWEREKWRYEGEQGETKSCLTIDLPGVLFKALAPREVDLPYLAHARQVDTGNKEVLSFNDRGWFSLVICNRLPQAEKGHKLLLVSLEGWQDCLKDNWAPAANQKVRLAVLGSWTFTCEGSNDFKGSMDRLNFGSQPPPAQARQRLPESGFHLPYKPYNKTSSSADDLVNAAYSRGYTAFDHAMRHGERIVSWYRGPLVPLSYNKPAQIQEPVSCADELLRYDPDTGLFDVTYAAAWQIGRLLALQNQAFALALDRVRGALRAKAERLMRHAELQQQRKQIGLPENDFLEDSLMEQLAGAIGKQLADAVPR